MSSAEQLADFDSFLLGTLDTPPNDNTVEDVGISYEHADGSVMRVESRDAARGGCEFLSRLAMNESVEAADRVMDVAIAGKELLKSKTQEEILNLLKIKPDFSLQKPVIKPTFPEVQIKLPTMETVAKVIKPPEIQTAYEDLTVAKDALGLGRHKPDDLVTTSLPESSIIKTKALEAAEILPTQRQEVDTSVTVTIEQLQPVEKSLAPSLSVVEQIMKHTVEPDTSLVIEDMQPDRTKQIEIPEELDYQSTTPVEKTLTLEETAYRLDETEPQSEYIVYKTTEDLLKSEFKPQHSENAPITAADIEAAETEADLQLQALYLQLLNMNIAPDTFEETSTDGDQSAPLEHVENLELPSVVLLPTAEELASSKPLESPAELQSLTEFLENPSIPLEAMNEAIEMPETLIEITEQINEQSLETTLLQVAQILHPSSQEATGVEVSKAAGSEVVLPTTEMIEITTEEGFASTVETTSAEVELRVELQDALSELHVAIQESAVKQEIGDEEVPAITPEVTEKMLAVLRIIGYEEPAKALVAFAEKYGTQNLVRVFQQLSLMVYDADHKEILSVASLSATADDSSHRIGSALLWLVRRLQPTAEAALS